MESRNILLVVICICAFLVIIFGIGFVWSMPDRISTGTERPGDDEVNGGIDIFEHVRDENDPPGLDPTEPPSSDPTNTSDQMTLVYGEQGEETEETQDTGDEHDTSETGEDSDTVTIHAPTEDEPEYPKTWIVKPQPTPIPVTPTTAPKRTKHVIEYWIQAGSFTKRSSADDLTEKLAEHGFQAQVRTRELDGITYYRVRIGPYENKKEAEKFLDWIKVLEGMQESYISQITTDKWVN